MNEDELYEFCSFCGEEIDVEFVGLPGFRYRGHCACTAKEEKEREAEEKSRQRYDFRNGARDKTYKAPTLGDLLKGK